MPIPPRGTWRIRRNLERILALLDEHCQKATFFMLGSVAESDPALALMICSAGHEIASHGYSHRLVSDLTPQQFRDELQLTEQILMEQTGQRPIGFRAPQWSLTEQTGWAFAILRERGYRYDSSLNPLPFVGNYRGSRTPYRLEGDGEILWEIPPMVTRSWIGNLPTGGGWGFRFFPFRTICTTIETLNRGHHPAVLYLHPREVDPDGPRLELPALKRFVSYGTRTDAAPRLSELLRRYRFTALKEMVYEWQHVS
ncbi:MAG: polysaccharide deacetylase family protein [Desulfuromonadaceae bacterium]|nr:polysaccharide deacetylase family protein [Desulfuromonadaceae bacterium]